MFSTCVGVIHTSASIILIARDVKIFYIAMLDDFEIIKLLRSVIHNLKGILLRYIMVSVVWQYMN